MSSSRYSLRTALRTASTPIVLAVFLLLMTPSALFAADGSLPELTQPLSGNYCVASDGVALHQIERGTLQIPVDGTPIAAYLFWSGRDNDSTGGQDKVDDALMIAINGGEATELVAAEQQIGYAGFNVRYNFSYRSGNLAALIPANQPLAIDIWGLDHSERHGVSMVVVYESPACPENQINFHYGIDGFSRQRTGEAGPTSEIVCINFPSVDIDRTLAFQMGVGGVAGTHRGNELLFKTGTGRPPSDIIGDSDAQAVTGHPHNELYPLTGNGGEWDNYVNQIPVPAGATYACLQIDSVQTTVDGERIPGASGVWVDLVTQLTIPQPPVQTNPAIRIEKIADAAQVEAGTPIGFRLAVTSHGDSAAEDVFVSDSLPTQAGLAWAIDASSSDAGCGIDGGALTCRFGTLQPAESRTVHITSPTTAETANGCPGEATIDNRATVSIRTGQSHEDDASIRVSCQGEPAIAIQKVADRNAVNAGEEIGFRMMVTSNGTTAAEDVFVSDSLPTQAGLAWAIDASSSDAGCGIDGGALTCHFGTLQPAESRTVHITSPTTAETANGCPGEATIDNRATVSIRTGQSDEDDAVTRVSCQGEPAIAIQKVADKSEISIGEEIGFQMVVTSIGTIPALDVTLTDALPAANTFAWRIDVAQSDAGCAIAAGLLSCHFGTLQPGEERGVHITARTEAPEEEICELPVSSVDNRAVVTESTGLSAEDSAHINIQTVCPPHIPAGLGNFVWEDLNGNGLQDASEPGIAGALVSLHSDAGTVLAQQQTGADGRYLFADLDAGTYYLHFATPEGFVPTAADMGTDDATDSDASVESGQTTMAVLNEGELDDRWDAGFYRPVSVGDYVWYDEFLPYGVQNPNENGASNIAVTLYDVRSNSPVKDASGAPMSTTTDVNGSYLFENLAPGSYFVAFELENLSKGFSPTNANAGDSDALDSDAASYISTSTIRTDGTGFLASGRKYLDLDMGVRACPTAITLAGFHASTGAQGVEISWNTITELNTWGYNIRRSATVNVAEAELINPYILFAKGQGGHYQFVDDSVAATATPYYWLEEVGTDGASCTKELFGPFRTQNANVKPMIYLPLVTK